MKRIHLRTARERAKLTQPQLAALVNVKQQAISHLETTPADPRLSIGLKLAAALNVDPRALVFGRVDAA